MSLSDQQYAALCESSLRELLRLLAAARNDKRCVSPEDAFCGRARDEFLSAEAKARHLVTALKP